MGLVSSHTKQENAANNTPPLTNLPAEIIYNILSFLPPISLGAVAQTCRLLSEHAYDDKLWQAIVHSNLPATTLKTAAPSPSFRHLYLSHLPYWFLPKHKIWFSDTQATGKLLIARYSPSRQTIEAYTVTASRGTSTFKFWKWNPEVVIHTFEPTVRLDLNQSLLRLRPRDISSSSGALTSEIYMQAETPMRSYRTHQNGHQPDKNRGLPEGAKEAIHARRFLGEPGSRTTETAVTDAEENPAAESQLPGQINSWPGSETTVAPIITQGDIYTPKEDDCNEDRIYRGQLLAVKLTGDTNIPRGEYTFIAPDIGKDGTVRIANEEMFKGARIVTSVGHIAARGYREDQYIPSQLILISHDTIAQYWETFGHISFYKRVDIDSLISAD
ncbi:F-box domain protein [Venturia nashicola]|uniref:F-box domain protein n=1 Tax=Venturia nashicola TaxID=86259 RepID=A0A4Z1PLU1_9PEZI|nr:F-box domain protein [Venturia nashicola]